MLTAAAILLLLIALTHSIGGELFLFRRLPELHPLPAIFGADARRALRACWHTATVLGGGLAMLLLDLASRGPLLAEERLIVKGAAAALLGCSLLWLVVSRGRHIGWIGFLAVAVLCWMAESA
jgi:hypothetical protein